MLPHGLSTEAVLDWHCGVEWSGVEWSGVEWSGVEWSGVVNHPLRSTDMVGYLTLRYGGVSELVVIIEEGGVLCLVLSAQATSFCLLLALRAIMYNVINRQQTNHNNHRMISAHTAHAAGTHNHPYDSFDSSEADDCRSYIRAERMIDNT